MEPETVGATPRRNFGRIVRYLILAIIVVVIGLFLSYTFLSWAVYEHMYQIKFDGMDWFGTVFYHGWAFIFPALIALVVIYPYPNRSDLFAFLRTLTSVSRQRGMYTEYRGGGMADMGVIPREVESTSRAIWITWQVVKWAVAYVVAYFAQGFLFYPNMTEAWMLNLYGYGSWSLVPRIFALPLFQANGQEIVNLIPTMEAQYYLVVGVIGTILVILAIRFLLQLLADAFSKSGNKWIVDLLAFVFVVLFGIWMGAPYWLMNVTTPYLYGVLIVFMLGALFGIAYFRLSGKGLIPITARRRGLTKIVAIIIAIALILQLGTLAYIGANWNNNWLQYAWQPQVQQQIGVTRWSAGLDNISASPISSIPTGSVSRMLSLVRQWDDNASLIRSQSQIGVNYLAIPSAEITYLDGQQYWVQPTTIVYPPNGQDWISQHLIYTHADRIIVLNAHTGDYVSLSQALGVPPNPAIDNPLIYYGESGGFYNNVYVNVANEPPQIGGVTYSWAPDYVLSGAQRALWFFAQGPTTWGFAFSPPQNSIPMLFNRDVINRVSSTLINGLVADPQTYLVTNGQNLYYAVLVYINYPLQTGFAQSDFLRNFAVVLVNVNDGSMSPYIVDNSSNFLSSFYRQYYPSWNTSLPSWLVPQLRYPQQLLGNQQVSGQLDADFLYHVNSSNVWRSGSDFYERPQSTPVYYVVETEGNSSYYVGLQLAEFQVSPGKNLGGIYVAYGGSRLGQISLYQVNSASNSTNKIIGPGAALQALETNTGVKEQLTLLTNPTTGNVLPYLINATLYYFIPVYVNTGSSSAVITKLAFMVVVDATNGVSAYGPSSSVAYVNLLAAENQTSTIAPPINATSTLQNVVNAFAAKGYTVATPSSVNVNLGYNVSSISLTSTTVAQVNMTVGNFVSQYAVPKGATTIYEWSPSSGVTNFGIIVASGGVTEAYYISVKG